MQNLRTWARTFTFCAFGAFALIGACVTEQLPDAACGDSEANGDDECDGSDFAGATCASAGFDEGSLGCSSSCTIDTTACVLLDEDNDQLNIYEEEYWGTDPLNPDTDGDGLLDGLEYNNGADPLDETSWPGWIGGWPNRLQAAVDASVTGTGLEIGDIATDKAWTDQYGETVNLHQFYGYVTVLTVAARWCPPCQLASQTSQALLSQHQPQGVIFIEQLINGLDPNTNATQDDVGLWANEYALEYPVVFSQDPFATPSIPTYFILDKQLRITNKIEGFPGDPALSFAINSAVAASE